MDQFAQTSGVSTTLEDHEYPKFEQTTANMPINHANGPLFVVQHNLGDLYDIFLSRLPAKHRQEYNCRACREFVNKYGCLGWVDNNYNLQSLFWYNLQVPAIFAESVGYMRMTIETGSIKGVFISREKVWGKPVTGSWTHLHGTPNASMIFNHSVLSADQRAAELQQDCLLLARTLGSMKTRHFEEAVRLLESDRLEQGDRYKAMAEWFLNWKLLFELHHGRQRDNLVWLAAATAPTGYAHAKNGMLGTLLEAIKEGKSFEAIKRAWAEKMHPLQFQRSTAAVTEGNAKQAEKLFEQMDLAPTLERRFARIDDIADDQRLWSRPVINNPEKSMGLFTHLVKDAQPAQPGRKIVLPTQNITVELFKKRFLSNGADGRRITKLEVKVPEVGAFFSFVAPVHPEKKLLQWDNQFSWYLYHGGSKAVNWNVTPGQWKEVVAVTTSPFHWGDIGENGFSHLLKGLYFIVDGCRDLNYTQGGSFFPGDVRSELHGVRKTLEAAAKMNVIKGKEEASACGLLLHNTNSTHQFNLAVRVNGVESYRFDRWE